MEFADVVRRRRMVRRYRPDPVAPDALERVTAAAVAAPSAGWSQGVRLVVVTQAGPRRELADLCGEAEHVARGFSPWLSVAPVHIILCVRPDDYRERYAEPDKQRSRSPDQWRVPYWWVDAGAALEALLLAAVDEGLGAGFLDVADPDAVSTLLGIPADVKIVGLVTVGHAQGGDRRSSSLRRGRRPDVVRHERW